MTNPWDEFFGPNAGYALELYERYRQDPNAVDAAARAFFERHPPPKFAPAAAPQAALAPAGGPDPQKIAGALNLAQAIRVYGHWAARLDPLGSLPPGDPSLHAETYALNEEDLRALPAALVGGAAGARFAAGGSAWDAIEYLRAVYSGTLGHDYLQIKNAEERQWLREAAETGRFGVEQHPIDALALLDRLTQVEVFEHFLQRSFPGKTRFSIEGLDTLVPLLDLIIDSAAEAGIYHVLLGMAHRGRLNVLAHVLNKPLDQMLAEFKDPLARRAQQNDPTGWTGDVKYHAGGRRVIDPDQDPDTINLTIQLVPNPSHLEAVNPVVEGMARAAGTQAGQPGAPRFDPAVSLPVVIHGDAAFPGQGVVAETLNLHRLKGYSTGGTIHIIANNQIGFTTDEDESRSTLFASDLAKGYRIPVLHANADDPEGVITAARIAFAYRERFHNDVLINLIGYRRLGHNEGDEPAFTQPALYKKIAQHPSARKIWAGRLVQRGVISADLPERLYQEKMDALQNALDQLDPERLVEPIPPPPPPGAARKVQTAVDAARLARLYGELLRLPVGFTLHPRLARIRQRREKLLEEGEVLDGEDHRIDWATAEELAFATLLEDGVPIRLTGQDVERGTFSQRHAVLHDAASGEQYIPLHGLPQARASFEVRNSPLSEYAALGFEFGYNVQASGRLVIWEAQYGDFINNAQTVVDEFIVSARDKWGQLPSLVLLLPHGYEGQGPDHSSARLERFLNLTADNNLRVAYPTTAANYFHLLRRQAALLEVDPLPLVVMTPKSLLRHPLVASPLSDFTSGGWQPVIAGEDERAGSIRRLVLCSGKLYVELATSDLLAQHPEMALARVEQLAPFPEAEVRALLARYPALEEVTWAQEEPENMGAWAHVRAPLDVLSRQAGVRGPLRLAARPRSASPAEGSSNLHAHNQRRLIERIFETHEEKRSRDETAAAKQAKRTWEDTWPLR